MALERVRAGDGINRRGPPSSYGFFLSRVGAGGINCCGRLHAWPGALRRRPEKLPFRALCGGASGLVSTAGLVVRSSSRGPRRRKSSCTVTGRPFQRVCHESIDDARARQQRSRPDGPRGSGSAAGTTAVSTLSYILLDMRTGGKSLSCRHSQGGWSVVDHGTAWNHGGR
ncbi:uncharacterized protein B0I36DRAFT_42869 [Microdochium trichocladiopsis]|uniref:Uncharacterized protein n=1 Tax=Microdochium trichocladiopsis TaxID=1682393 RepID=A0A9P8XT64_9PEZI|nr:uncharacterized protein B0I36DRAFT_42869 [Microdochium trichocladiopsis]KAH7016114.1 hypothetical protein B0I36DRAFT_42869 [Microdochium trichocladiopsis]